MALPRIFTDLVNHLTLLPGVGEKTAERYVYSLCDKEPEEVEKIDKNSLLEEDGSVNLPNVINKVRDFINSLDEVSDLITTSELDLTDTYQIIIEIDKNSH